MEALQRAKQHNLNVATIATETVRMILEAVFSVITFEPDVKDTASNLRTYLLFLVTSPKLPILVQGYQRPTSGL